RFSASAAKTSILAYSDARFCFADMGMVAAAGFKAVANFSKSIRLTVVLHSVPAAGLVQKPSRMITGSSGPTVDEGGLGEVRGDFSGAIWANARVESSRNTAQRCNMGNLRIARGQFGRENIDEAEQIVA